MSAQHTPGRLRYDYEPGYCGELLAPNDTSICSFCDEPSEANARRLVAAWNACEGISTEALEAYGDKRKHPFKDLFLDMEQKENELRAALSGLLSYFESGNSVPVDKATIKADSPEVIAARAAIQKVEGK